MTSTYTVCVNHPKHHGITLCAIFTFDHLVLAEDFTAFAEAVFSHSEDFYSTPTVPSSQNAIKDEDVFDETWKRFSVISGHFQGTWDYLESDPYVFNAAY